MNQHENLGCERIGWIAGGLIFDSAIEQRTGRERLDAVQSVLEQAGVRGEIGYILHDPRNHRLRVPVFVPGREEAVEIDLREKSAQISESETGLQQEFLKLHKSPGPHIADIRMNWFPMRIWRWLAIAGGWIVCGFLVVGLRVLF
jgi:hypothetical protein